MKLVEVRFKKTEHKSRRGVAGAGVTGHEFGRETRSLAEEQQGCDDVMFFLLLSSPPSPVVSFDVPEPHFQGSGQRQSGVDLASASGFG